MEMNYHYKSGGENRDVRKQQSLANRKKIYQEQVNFQEVISMDPDLDNDPEVQHDQIINSLANDEALLNDFLEFRQHQAQNRMQKVQTKLQIPPNTSTPNKRRLNDSSVSGGLPTPKQQRPANQRTRADEIILGAPADGQHVNTMRKNENHNKIPFEQLKRAVSSNLPCFYVLFQTTSTEQKVPSAFYAAEKILEYLKSQNVHIKQFTFVGWAGKKLKLGVNDKEDYMKLVETEKWPTSIMNIPITIEKPKFIPDCFALVIRYVPRNMDYEQIKEEIARSIASVVNLKRIQYPYNRKTDDYRFHIKDAQEYNRALNMKRISISNIMLPITRFLEGNKLTYCTRCWVIGHMRNKCQAESARCRICLQTITDIQMHNCSQQLRCAQCDGNHHSLSSQCEAIKAYKLQLKDEVDSALARGVIHRVEVTQQDNQYNSEDFPPLVNKNTGSATIWGSKVIPRQQPANEHTEITGILTTLNKQLLIITETNIRVEKSLEEMNMSRKRDVENVELLQKTMINTLHSILEVMDMMIIPLCERANINTKRKGLPFMIILQELQNGISIGLSKYVSDKEKDGQTDKGIMTSSTANKPKN